MEFISWTNNSLLSKPNKNSTVRHYFNDLVTFGTHYKGSVKFKNDLWWNEHY